MPSLKPVYTTRVVPKGTRILVNRKTGGRFLVSPNYTLRNVKPFLIQGRGSRFTVRYAKYLTPDLQRIKARQTRAERKAGIRVGNGLFDNPLSERPVVIGMVKPQRRKQQHPHSGKAVRQRRGSTGKHSKARKVSGLSASQILLRQGRPL